MAGWWRLVMKYGPNGVLVERRRIHLTAEEARYLLGMTDRLGIKEMSWDESSQEAGQ